MKFEQSGLRFKLPALLVLCLCAGLGLAAPTYDPDFKTTCFRNLVETYSMEGLDAPEQISIKMCNNVRKTCCQVKDQETMFANWVHGKEEAKLDEHYARNVVVYGKLVAMLSDVQQFATDVKGVIVKKVSNCKLMAERILNFEIPTVQKKINENLKGMHRFFVKTYKGFYCSICNHDLHRFFKKDAMTIIFSEKFCRDIVEQTLTTLVLFHVDIIKLLNLITKFVTSCDMNGDYNIEATFPKDLMFDQNQEVVNSLRLCRDNRNKKEWFSYCKEICMNFQLTQFPKFFEPNVDKIEYYNRSLNNTLADIAEQRRRHPPMTTGGALPSPQATPGQPKPGRVLADEKDKKDDGLIFKPGLSPKVILDSWKRDFTEEGISLYDEGGASSISEGVFNTVKADLQLARDGGSQAAAMLTKVERDALSRSGKRELSSVAIFKALTAALTALLFVFGA